MWNDLDEPDPSWEPLRTRRRGQIRVVAIVIAVAMVLALVVPVLIRLMGDAGDKPNEPDGVNVLELTTEQAA